MAARESGGDVEANFENSMDAFDPGKRKAIEDLKQIASYIEDGGDLILAGCHTAAYSDGTNFVEQVSALTDHRLNIYASQDFVTNGRINTSKHSMVKGGKVMSSEIVNTHVFLDVPLSGGYFRLGWKKAEANWSSAHVTGQDLKLNSKGKEPVSNANK